SSFSSITFSSLETVNGILNFTSEIDKIEKKGDLLKLPIKKIDLINELEKYLYKTFGNYVFTFTSFNYNGNFNLDVLDFNKKLLKRIDLKQFQYPQTKEDIAYYDSGKIKLKSYAVDGIPQGESIAYYESGKVKATSNFIDGIPQGEFILYYESGKVKMTYDFVDGNIQGEAEEYYESGEVKITKNFVDGITQGEAVEYYESGEVKVTINYVDGNIQGEVVYYDVNGKILEIANFKDGVKTKP
ncbi:MAG: toxin-antitoxin system YwqK family antitoxin, partial [Flavobacteriaceae bacterium]|nr:toxin-antitoxin system YwqK family antitoxin [Flavobacteriaceae bacterium]